MSDIRRSYAVWEITLACNLACQHCGSRAGNARTDELSTAEALDLVQQLHDVGVTEVTLIGGEAFMRPDWLDIARAIHQSGMLCSMTTGGMGISQSMAYQMKTAGISTVSISVDGLSATHDTLRGKPGSWKSCFRTMAYLQEAGIFFGCNTQINRRTAPELPLVYEAIRDAGAGAWQIQLTVPMGNAVEHREILLQPYELLAVYPMLAELAHHARQDGVDIQPGNNIGYFGPYERLLRGKGDDWGFWRGCVAGLSTLGIEADGTIKGCPSLPTSAYAGGNIRERSLRDIIEFAPQLNINQLAETQRSPDYLWGFCQTCEFADLCRAGCTWTSHVFFDQRGNNPYCHHRALFQAKRGIRERLELKQEAQGLPFDNGQFTLIEEPLNASLPISDLPSFALERVQWPENWIFLHLQPANAAVSTV